MNNHWYTYVNKRSALNFVIAVITLLIFIIGSVIGIYFISSDQQGKIEQIQADYQNKIQELQSDNQSKIEQIQADYQNKIQELQSDNQSKIEQIQADYQNEIQELQSDNQSKIEQIQADYRNQLCEIQNELMYIKRLNSSKNSTLLTSTLYKSNGNSGAAYNYLVIGNSITLHEKCDYWFGEWGMAASQAENDYFHLLTNYISRSVPVIGTAINFAVWEMSSHDRTQTLGLLDEFLNIELDAIIVQLGENVSDTKDFFVDFKELVSYLQQYSPNAKIVVIDDFWYNSDRIESKLSVSQEYECSFVSLSEIRSKDEYMCGMNSIVYGDDGGSHIVTHGGVARHPGDKGMGYYAKAIYDKLEL